jgi:hypothetical protein
MIARRSTSFWSVLPYPYSAARTPQVPITIATPCFMADGFSPEWCPLRRGVRRPGTACNLLGDSGVVPDTANLAVDDLVDREAGLRAVLALGLPVRSLDCGNEAPVDRRDFYGRSATRAVREIIPPGPLSVARSRAVEPGDRCTPLLGSRSFGPSASTSLVGQHHMRGPIAEAASDDVTTGTTSKSTRSFHCSIHASRRRRSSHSMTW